MKSSVYPKRKILFALSLVSGLTLASLASANMASKKYLREGGLVGNGGGTVVCRDTNHQIKRVELLDFYESMLHPGMKIDIQSIPGDWKAKAQAILERIQAKSEMRFQLYSLWLANFENERQLLSDVQMSTVTDSGYIGVPSGCAFEQAAIQKQPVFSGDARYFLNAELWNAMDDSQKAGLVLHEMIYREAIGYGHTDSIRARYLTGLYSSEGFAKQTLPQYWKVLDQAHFELVDIKLIPELKGTITSRLKTKRLWQAAPDEKHVPGNLELDDELLLSLGKCSGAGCSVFESHYEGIVRLHDTYQSQLAWNDVFLPVDLADMRIGETVTGNSVTVSIGSLSSSPQPTLEGVRLVMGRNDNSDFALELTAQPTNRLDLRQASGKWALDVSTISFSKTPSSSWLWKNITARTIVEPSSGTWHDGTFGLEIAHSVFGKCILPSVEYENGQIFSVNASRLIFNGTVKNNCFDKVQIWDQLSNGSASFFTDINNTYHLDASHPGRLVEKVSQFYDWRTEDTLVSCNMMDNCLATTSSADSSVNTLTVGEGAAQVQFGRIHQPQQSGPNHYTMVIFANRVHVKPQSRIELYPNGMPKGFLADASEVLLMPDQSLTTIHAGNFVELDDHGNVKAIQ